MNIYKNLIKKSKIVMTLISLSIILSACSSQNKFSSIEQKDEMTMNLVELTLDTNSKSFKNHLLVIRLYEYDPRLADAKATLIDLKEFKVDSNSSFPITYSIFDEMFKNSKKYYLVARIYDENGKQTHHGYKDGKEGFIKILEKFNKILVILR